MLRRSSRRLSNSPRSTPSHSRSEERRVGKERRSLCDWSSDVCSSDLAFAQLGRLALADPADIHEGVKRTRPDTRQLAQRRIAENHVGGDAAFRRDAAAKLAQALEQSAIDALPFEIGRASCREREEITV